MDYLYAYKAELLRVVDGDTVVVNIDLGFDVNTRRVIRLKGIDTPELSGGSDKQKLAAQIASQELERLLSNKELKLCSMKEKQDKYKRYLGILYVNEININYLMICKGLAKAYKDEKPSWTEAEYDEIIRKYTKDKEAS